MDYGLQIPTTKVSSQNDNIIIKVRYAPELDTMSSHRPHNLTYKTAMRHAPVPSHSPLAYLARPARVLASISAQADGISSCRARRGWWMLPWDTVQHCNKFETGISI